MVEKAAELGVTEVIPLETARTVAVSSKVREPHVERFQRRALEAIKQSGAAWAPVVRPVVRLEAWLAEERARAGGASRRWLADIAGGPGAGVLSDTPVVVVIGPEGGFEAAERAALLDGGFEPIAFAAQTLRFETAAIAAAVVVAGARRRVGAPSRETNE